MHIKDTHPLVTNRLTPLLEFCHAKGFDLTPSTSLKSQDDHSVSETWQSLEQQQDALATNIVSQALQILPAEDFDIACSGTWRSPTGLFWIDIAKAHGDPFELLLDLIGEVGFLVTDFPLKAAVPTRNPHKIIVHFSARSEQVPVHLGLLRLIQSELKSFAAITGIKGLKVSMEQRKNSCTMTCRHENQQVRRLPRMIKRRFNRVSPKLISALEFERSRTRYWHEQTQSAHRTRDLVIEAKTITDPLLSGLLARTAHYQFEVADNGQIKGWQTPSGILLESENLPDNLSQLIEKFEIKDPHPRQRQNLTDGLPKTPVVLELFSSDPDLGFTLCLCASHDTKTMGYLIRKEHSAASPALSLADDGNAFLQRATEAVCITNQQGLIMGCNNAFAALAGMAKEAVSKLQIDQFLPPALSDRRLRDHYRGTSALANSIELTAIFQTDGSRQIPVNVCLKQVKDPLLTVNCYQLQDISRTIELQESLLQTEQALAQHEHLSQVGQMTQGVAHDLGNLLTLAHGYTTELTNQRDGSTDPNLKALTDVLDDAIAISRSILRLPSSDNPSSVSDLRQVLPALSEQIRMLLGPGTSFELNLPAGNGPLLANIESSQLMNIVINLTINARDAMPNRGHFQIRVSSTEKRTQSPGILGYSIEFIDSGVGIPRELQSMIFEQGFTTKASRGGRGLGLHSIRTLLRARGGDIQVQSSPSGGALQMFIPRSLQPAKSQLSRPFSNDSAFSNTSALVVEPNPHLRAFITLALKSMGIDCIATDSGKQALAIYREKSMYLDLVVSELVLPDLGGQAFLAEVDRLSSHQSILVVSAFNDAPPHNHFLANKSWEQLDKPFGLEHLKTAITAALGNAQSAPRAYLSE